MTQSEVHHPTMQKVVQSPVHEGAGLEFPCCSCGKIVAFSVTDVLSDKRLEIKCEGCQQGYLFEDPVLRGHMRKFVALCSQIQDSEEILSKTSVGVTVANRTVKVPYNLLLTRLNSFLELELDGKTICVQFRTEPCSATKF